VVCAAAVRWARAPVSGATPRVAVPQAMFAYRDVIGPPTCRRTIPVRVLRGRRCGRPGSSCHALRRGVGARTAILYFRGPCPPAPAASRRSSRAVSRKRCSPQSLRFWVFAGLEKGEAVALCPRRLERTGFPETGRQTLVPAPVVCHRSPQEGLETREAPPVAATACFRPVAESVCHARSCASLPRPALGAYSAVLRRLPVPSRALRAPTVRICGVAARVPPSFRGCSRCSPCASHRRSRPLGRAGCVGCPGGDCRPDDPRRPCGRVRVRRGVRLARRSWGDQRRRPMAHLPICALDPHPAPGWRGLAFSLRQSGSYLDPVAAGYPSARSPAAFRRGGAAARRVDAAPHCRAAVRVCLAPARALLRLCARGRADWSTSA